MSSHHPCTEYIDRVYVLTKSKILGGAIGALSILGCVFGIIAGIRSGIINECVHLPAYRGGESPTIVYSATKFGPIGVYVILWLSFQSGADFLITGKSFKFTTALHRVMLTSPQALYRSCCIVRRLAFIEPTQSSID